MKFIVSWDLDFQVCMLLKSALEGVHGIRPSVTLGVMSISPFVLQASTRQFEGESSS